MRRNDYGLVSCNLQTKEHCSLLDIKIGPAANIREDDNILEAMDPNTQLFGIADILPEFILLILPPKPEAFPGKPELGQGLDGTDSLLEVETKLFLVFTPMAKTQQLSH